ncbi:MAG TPA: hypothetical protein VM076_18545 [Gemmatimonadaceae bacterium]|nr:hypothetical protein [Gemmatimonadaceae bacterium]
MSIRNILLSMIALVASGATSVLTPCAMQAQGSAQNPTPGQMVEVIARSNAAHMALVRKAASDAAFAEAMKNAMNSRNYDAAAALVSTATGVAKANIRASVKSSADVASTDAGASPGRPSVFHLASLESVEEQTTVFFWNFCLTFSFGGIMNATRAVVGCVATWPWG